MYRRCTHNLRILAIGRSKPILVALHIGYGRSILSFPILIHTLLSADLSTERSAIIYRSHTLNDTPIGCTSLNGCADVVEPIQLHLVT
jgi:hypothetical protein